MKAYEQNAYDKYIENDISATIKATGGAYGGGSETLITENKAVATDLYNGQVTGDKTATLTAHTGTSATCAGPSVIENSYIVRRLTPTECARLQGFPDSWGDIDRLDDMDDETYKFWLDVRQTFDEINGRNPKDYTKENLLKWYNGLHSDANEYKMWGNGVALPCVLYIMEGIEEYI